MNLQVRTVTGRTIKYKMSPDCRVKDLQDKIEETEGLSPDLQYILTDKRKLLREERLSEIAMHDGYTLNLLSKVKAGLSVEIVAINGTTLTIDIDKDTTVYQLKELIKDKNDVAIQAQRLVISHGHGNIGMEGEIMMDKKKVVSYLRNDVRGQSVISMVLKRERGSQALELLEIDDKPPGHGHILSYICPCFNI